MWTSKILLEVTEERKQNLKSKADGLQLVAFCVPVILGRMEG